MDRTYKEFVKNAESQIADLKKEIKESEFRKEEALSKQTQFALEIQQYRLKV